jgi:hypothetical protein
MNLLDLLLQAQNGGAAQQLGRQFGLDASQTQSALAALLPALAGALNQNAQAPGGLDELLGALGSGRHTRYIDQPAALGDPSTVADGNGILGHLFGSKEVSREVAARAAQRTGIGPDVLKQMLPIVAAMVMGGLAKQVGGASGAGAGTAFGGAAGAGGMGMGMGGVGGALGGMLGGAKGGGGARAGSPAGGLFELLTPMLDRNRDGSAVDDVLRMAAGFLGRR